MYFGTKYKNNYYYLLGYMKQECSIKSKFVYEASKPRHCCPAEPQTNQHQIRLAGRLETGAKTDWLQSVDIFQIFLHNSDSSGG